MIFKTKELNKDLRNEIKISTKRHDFGLNV